jgi:hypothetical protein
MKKKQSVINFKWGSLPVDALNEETMSQLRIIANRRRTSIEQVMSQALDWCLGTQERGSSQARHV